MLGQIYASILGPLAMVVVVLRGLWHDAPLATTVATGLMSLFVFAVLGFVLGEIAKWIVEDSVHTKLQADLAADQQT